ncbi:MAG TPA: hypothetical protein VFC93_00040 [Chloroflexota bacterium]|nr:hypothetical protein [Chloroflexota bacterium]
MAEGTRLALPPPSCAEVRPLPLPSPTVAAVLALLLAAAPPAEQTVEIDEALLTSQLNTRASGRSLGVTALGTANVGRVAIGMHDGQIVVTGTADTGWTLMSLDFSATAAVDAGQVSVLVDDGYLGNTPLPGQARRVLACAVRDQIEEDLGGRRFSVRSLSVGEGRLVATGSLGAPIGP